MNNLSEWVGRVSTKGRHEGSVPEGLFWRVHMKGTEVCHEGSNLKGYKVLHVRPYIETLQKDFLNFPSY